MWNGIAIGIGRSGFSDIFAGSYATRVTADGGTIEALTCVAAASSLLKSASLLIIPSGYKAGVAYAELPANGNGDLTWFRNSVANRTQSNGNIGSVAANVPRLDYTYGSCPALLLEPQRTNSFRNSTMQGASTSPSTLPTNWIASLAGLTQTIVGVGTENGLPYIDVQFSGTATGTLSTISFESNSQIVSSNGQTWTGSFWVKQIAAPTPPNSYSSLIRESNSSGLNLATTAQSFTISSTLNRITQTRTNSNASTAYQNFSFAAGVTIGQSYDFTVRIAAPQLELGAYATTWINTTNAAATRVGDYFRRSNIRTNGLISASGGTWYVELRGNVSLTAESAPSGFWLGTNLFTDNSNGTIYFRQGGGSQRTGIWKYEGGIGSVMYATTTETVKLAIKWNGTTADIFANGTKVVTATSFTATNMEFLAIASTGIGRTFFIQAMALYPTPISDADCEVLTGTSYSSYSAMATALGYTIL
jgi:hypothetical protein